MSKFDKESFIEKLNACHEWPGSYTFKFIVPLSQHTELLNNLPMGTISERKSKNGQYISVTIKSFMNDAEAVWAVYERVALIEQVISL